MAAKKTQNKRSVLTIIWIVTAVAAMVVTVIYLGRLQTMYSALNTNTTSAGDITSIPEDGQIDYAVGDPESNNSDKNSPSGESDTQDDSRTGLSDGSSKSEGSANESDTDITEAENANGSDTEGSLTGTSQANEIPEGKPYYYVELDPSKPIIALSFDDGPSIYTERILAALEKYNVQATFFMVGYNISAYPEKVKMVYDAGCEVANHTQDHENLNKLSDEDVKKQVYGNEDLINTIIPVGEIPLRPPYGNANDKVKSIVERPMFNWSVDSLDWKSRNADSVVEEIKANAKDGYVILMHDLYESTAEATERIIPWLLEQGYQVTCISNMFEARGEETLPGHLYRYTAPAPEEQE